MATKKAGGSTKNGRTSRPKYLGVKRSGGSKVPAGAIILRQRGTKWHPGLFVGIGKDDTLYAKIEGYVRFHHQGVLKRHCVSIVPIQKEGSVSQTGA
jgi:large subunit ribosomal protein L27